MSKVKERFCCQAWGEALTDGHLGWIPARDGEPANWAIEGCCGGCYIFAGVQFCPFCGASKAEGKRTPAEVEHFEAWRPI